MNSLKIALAAAALSAMTLQPAFAADKAKVKRADVECEVSKEPAAESKKSRAEVKAEARAANKAGTIECGEAGKPVATPPSDKSREEVKAEARAAAKQGKLPKGEAGEAAKK